MPFKVAFSVFLWHHHLTSQLIWTDLADHLWSAGCGWLGLALTYRTSPASPVVGWLLVGAESDWATCPSSVSRLVWASSPGSKFPRTTAEAHRASKSSAQNRHMPLPPSPCFFYWSIPEASPWSRGLEVTSALRLPILWSCLCSSLHRTSVEFRPSWSTRANVHSIYECNKVDWIQRQLHKQL